MAQKYQYAGSVSFFSETYKKRLKNIPCVINHKNKKNNRPSANYSYRVFADIQSFSPGSIYLHTSSTDWTPIKKSSFLVEKRHQLKEKCKAYFSSRLQNPLCAQFFSALVIGELPDKYLQFFFSKAGLDHILAISGFHFGVIVLFLTTFLGQFLKGKSCHVALLICISGYFLFLGTSCSIERAFIMAFLAALAKLLKRIYSPLNALGIALCIQIFQDPFAILQKGFQLSYLATLAILLLYSPIENIIAKWFPEGKKENVSFFQKIENVFLLFLKGAVAMQISIFLLLGTVLLCMFNKITLLSFIYNLFVPHCIPICMYLFIISILVDAIFPYLGSLIFSLTNFLTTYLLEIITHPMLFLDFSFRSQIFSFPVTFFCVSFALFLGIYLSKNKKENEIFSYIY